MQTTSIELSGKQIYIFEDTTLSQSRIVIEYNNQYLCAELFERASENDLLAVWIYPDELKGKAIHADDAMELERLLDKEPIDSKKNLLLTETGRFMMHDFQVMECLKDYAEETVNRAQMLFKEAFHDRPGIWTLSHDEFVQYRQSIKADFNAGLLTKEEYSKQVSKSYYANRN